MREETAVEARTSALIVTDIQPDFMPGGALPVSEGDLIVSAVSALALSNWFEVVLATQDWHPPNHVSFASNHPGRRPFDVIELYGHPQTLWPDHCVQGAAGAELCSDLPLNRLDGIIRKGTDPTCDSYSGFRNNWDAKGERPRTGLAAYLRERGVHSVFICGLARDYCIKWSAEDAAEAGFRTNVIWDLTRPVDARSDGQVRQDLLTRGVIILNSSELHPFSHDLDRSG